MEKIEVISLQPEDWQKYKAIRLEALAKEPDSFESIYEKEVGKPDDFWKTRLKHSTILFLKINENIIGMGGIYYEKNKPDIANIWGIYVNEKYRGRGYGKMLMAKLLEKVYDNKNVNLVKLCVNTNKLPAIKLYEKMGFKITKKKEKALKNKYDEYFMEKMTVVYN